MAVCNLLATLALYMLAGCFAEDFSEWYLDDNQSSMWNGNQGICELSPTFSVVTAARAGVVLPGQTVWISAMDGSQCFNDSEFAAMNSDVWDSGSCRNSYFEWNVLYRYVSDQVVVTHGGKVSFALMMAFSMLVAMNTGLVAIAVLGEYTTVATCLNLIFIVYFRVSSNFKNVNMHGDRRHGYRNDRAA